jgi:hypothetical protein
VLTFIAAGLADLRQMANSRNRRASISFAEWRGEACDRAARDHEGNPMPEGRTTRRCARRESRDKPTRRSGRVDVSGVRNDSAFTVAAVSRSAGLLRPAGDRRRREGALSAG